MRWAVALAIVAACAGQLLWRAIVDAEMEFLRPSRRGEWIVHPATPVRFNPSPACPDGIFELRAFCPELPSEARVTITGLRGFRADVNDEAGVASNSAVSWKRGTKLDLLPYLQPGTNTLRVIVSGTEGPPALLVEGPVPFRSGTNWTLRLDRARPVQAALAGSGERALRPNKGALWRHERSRLFGWLLAALGLFLVYALVPVRLKPWLRRAQGPATGAGAVGGAPSRVKRGFARGRDLGWNYGVCAAILIAVAVVQYGNTAAYPHHRSPFDVKGHVDYVRVAAEQARVPMATDGWEMFQAPLYYFAAAQVYRLWGGRAAEPASLKAVQYFTTTGGLLTMVFALGLLWLVFPDRPLARNLGFASVAFVPVHFYMNPMITNEVFAGTVISGALLVVCWAFRSERPPWIRVVAAALACGAGLLSKYSGLFLFLAAGAWLGLRVLSNPRSIRAWGTAAAFAVGVLLVCGWYYQRNVVTYGNPFIGNWDKASGFHYEQLPGYRTAGFYGRFGSVLFDDPERSRWSSFWDGQYGSIWADSHHAFLDGRDPKTNLKVGAIVCLAVLPVTATLLGFGLAVAGLLRRRWDDPMLAVVLVTLLSLTGVLAFTMEVPTCTAIKGFFLLSLSPAAAVFAGLGFARMAQQVGRLRWLMYAWVTVLAALVLTTYRYG